MKRQQILFKNRVNQFNKNSNVQSESFLFSCNSPIFLEILASQNYYTLVTCSAVLSIVINCLQLSWRIMKCHLLSFTVVNCYQQLWDVMKCCQLSSIASTLWCFTWHHLEISWQHQQHFEKIKSSFYQKNNKKQ